VFHGCRDDLTQRIERLGTGHLVHWTGFVADEDLAVLHEGALANVLPSECEGFGLPAVEAAASGTAVIATTESPLPQLLAGGGLFVRPADTEALLAALRTMANDPDTRRAMAEIAHQRAHALTWGSAAANVLAAIEEAAA
jgi:glycosyltransferase involved in cell wall biosynthesis